MAISKQTHEAEIEELEDWSLNTEQMLFMLQRHNAIESAFKNDDVESLRTLASSSEFLTLFGDMGFDEAYDRYETMLEAEDAS